MGKGLGVQCGRQVVSKKGYRDTGIQGYRDTGIQGYKVIIRALIFTR